jgi:hypothetical protein
MNKFIVASAVVAAVLMAGIQANAVVSDPPIVYYSFNNTNLLDGTAAGTNNFLLADTGSAISTFTFKIGGTGTNFVPFAGTTVNAQPGFAAGNTAGANTWQGTTNYFQFTLNATGWQGIGITFAANRSNTGPTNMVLEYSTDSGSTFTTFTTIGITANANIGYTNDLSSITALDNNAGDVFRLRSTGATVGGTFRADNLTLYATAVPEPSTVALVGFSLAGLFAIRRRRS